MLAMCSIGSALAKSSISYANNHTFLYMYNVCILCVTSDMLFNACILHAGHAKVGESQYDKCLPVLFMFFCLCVVTSLILYVCENIYHPPLMWEGGRGSRRERERERESYNIMISYNNYSYDLVTASELFSIAFSKFSYM